MSRINVYQIDCKVYLLKNIDLKNMLYEISNFIDTSLGKDEEMIEFHNKRVYKNYVHSGFKEIEKDKQYKEGKIYNFSLRCIDEKLRDYFALILKETSTDTMKGLVTSVKIIPRNYIEKLYTLTPALIKLNGGYWKGNINFATYEKRLIDNSMKKAKAVLREEFSEDFMLYNFIKVLNNKPILNKFKDISLLGDKFELYIADNERAQEVAYILLGTGVMENNARGYGFVNYKPGI